MNALVRVEDFELLVDGEDHLIRDVDLAERLGFDRPRKIRDLIARWESDLGPILKRPTVGRVADSLTNAPPGRKAHEFWLTEEQALFIVAKSETPNAVALTKQIIRVFREAMRAYHERRGGSMFERLLAKVLAPKPSAWERMFEDSLVRELCRLDRIEWVGGAHPRHLASTNRKIYDLAFSTEIGRALKARNPTPGSGHNYHQDLTPEANDYFRRQLGVVEVIARGSANKADFWMRMHREYGGGMLQLPFGERLEPS